MTLWIFLDNIIVLREPSILHFKGHEKFAIWNEDLPKKVIIKSQRQFMYGSNFYESDVNNAIANDRHPFLFQVVFTVQNLYFTCYVCT